jgi:hypothetical protein
MNLSQSKRILSSLAVSGLLLLGLFLLLNGAARTARADPGNLFVTTGGSGVTCSQASPCDLMTALNQSAEDDTIYVAQGTYTGAGALWSR